MTLLVVIWAVFAVIFLALGMFHWNMRNKSISYLQLKGRQIPQGVTITAEIAGVDFVDFADRFNRYIDYYNQTARNQHKIQAIGILGCYCHCLVLPSHYFDRVKYTWYQSRLYLTPFKT